jgi:hypothetical protein
MSVWDVQAGHPTAAKASALRRSNSSAQHQPYCVLSMFVGLFSGVVYSQDARPHYGRERTTDQGADDRRDGVGGVASCTTPWSGCWWLCPRTSRASLAIETAQARFNQEMEPQSQINMLQAQRQAERYPSPAWEQTGRQLAAFATQLNNDQLSRLTPFEKVYKIDQLKLGIPTEQDVIVNISYEIAALTPLDSVHPSAQGATQITRLSTLRNAFVLQLDTLEVDIGNLSPSHRQG